MKRLYYCLFTFASAMSLLLCVATVVLLVRSYFVADELNHFLQVGKRQRIWSFSQNRGIIEVFHSQFSISDSPPGWLHTSRPPRSSFRGNTRAEKLGFAWDNHSTNV